ncbi:MAG: efflux RND transporter permease subunit, partial [Hyphomicrobiales bacterium]|nr:efflux RND transporter permease subunit [Hyphomicrobiales bacterium]
MTTLFYRNKRLFALAILLMLAAGSSAILTIGRQEDPTITNLFASIVTPFPGADPARVEALVTEKLEERLREIPEISEITSVSRLGVSVVQVELSQFISDEEIEQSWSEIRDALSDAAQNFPPGVPEPTFDNDRVGAYTNIVAIMADPDIEPVPAILTRYAKMLQDRQRALSGTKIVELYGDWQEEVLVTIDAIELLSLGLTSDAIANSISRGDAKVRSGQIRGERNDILIEVAGELKALDRIRAIPIAEGSDGRIVQVGDIGRVEKSFRQPPETLSLINGRPAVLIAARMEKNLQVGAWADRIKSIQQDFAAEMPSGLELRPIFDQATYTENRLTGVFENMVIGVVLVVFVLILSLGLRAAIIVAIIIPLSAIVSIFGLQLAGVPIQQMSLTGMIVSLGLLVDAAIVMTDEVRKKLRMGAERREAIHLAVKRLAAPLLASTVTTVLAFMPMVLLPGPAGDFVGSIAIAVIIMLVVSFGLALTITPAMSGWLLRTRADGQRSWLLQGLAFRSLGGAFGKLMRLTLNYPAISIFAALSLPIIGFASFPTLKPQFFPGVDRDQFYIQVELPEGTAIAQTERVALDIDALLKDTNGIETVS